MQVYCGDNTDSSAGAMWWYECFWAFVTYPMIPDKEYLYICSNNDRGDRQFNTPSLCNPFTGMKLIQEISRPLSYKDMNRVWTHIQQTKNMGEQ